jgi:hypothetical protein
MARPLKRIKRSLRTVALRGNAWLGRYEAVVWLIGDGRSGTTWTADLIKHGTRFREMFEPFHPRFVESMSFLQPHQYLRPAATCERLERIASSVFSGRFTHPRVDSANRHYKYDGILVKDIFAHLFARWASLRFPDVRIILLLRNPFSVALSKYRKRDWFWATEPLDLLNQTDLLADYLHPFEDVIRKTSREGDYILRQLAIWSIIHYVPLRQFAPGQITVAFYEDILRDPDREMARISGLVNSSSGSARTHELSRSVINKPSRVTEPDTHFSSRPSALSEWKNALSVKQIDAGFEILERFALDKLYGDDVAPNHDALRTLQEARAVD